MDSSDAIRKIQAKAVYSYYRNTVFSKQSTCNYSTCSTFTGCKVNYPDYDTKQKVATGAQACNGCTNLGCGCTG